MSRREAVWTPEQVAGMLEVMDAGIAMSEAPSAAAFKFRHALRQCHKDGSALRITFVPGGGMYLQQVEPWELT